MPSLQEIRSRYPQYHDLSDQQLADSLHQKHYSDMPSEQFYQKIGYAGPQLKPNNFMERAGMAFAGDQAQLTDVARQTSLYSQNALQGLLGLADVPVALYEIPGALTRPTTPGAPFVENLGDAVERNPFAPNLAQKFGQFAQDYTNGQAVPQDNREKVIAAEFQGAGAGIPFGPLAMAGGVLGGGVNQEALNKGWNPDLAAAVGAFGAGLTMKGPQILEGAVQKTGNVAQNVGRGIEGLDRDAASVFEKSKTMKSQYKPTMRKAKDVPLTSEASTAFWNRMDNLTESDGQPFEMGDLSGKAARNSINEALATYKDKTLTFGALEDIKQHLENNATGGDGNIKTHRVAAQNVRDFRNSLTDDMLAADSPDALLNVQNANKAYSAGSKVEDIGDWVKSSEGDVSKLQKLIRNKLKSENSDRTFRGYSPEQMDAIKGFANNSTGESFLSFIGSFGIDPQKLLSLGNSPKAALGGAAAYGIQGAALPVGATMAAGTGSKLLLNAIKRGQLKNIISDIEKSGAPSDTVVRPNLSQKLKKGKIAK